MLLTLVADAERFGCRSSWVADVAVADDASVAVAFVLGSLVS